MKKPVDAKALREKIEGLYEGVDLTQDDEQLLKNERASLQYQDPAFRAEWDAKNQDAIEAKKQNPEWYNDLAERNKKMAKDPKRNRKIRITVKKQYQDPEYREYRKSIQQEVAKTKEFKEAHAEGINKREENGWAEKNLKAREKTLKPIHAGEYGDFPSKKAAVEGMTKAGLGNAGGKLSVWLKTKSDEYYYF